MTLDPETQTLFEQLKFSCKVKVIRISESSFIGAQWEHNEVTGSTCWQPKVVGDAATITDWLTSIPIEKPYTRPVKTADTIRAELTDLAEIMKGL